eukprot:RCo039810
MTAGKRGDRSPAARPSPRTPTRSAAKPSPRTPSCSAAKPSPRSPCTPPRQREDSGGGSGTEHWADRVKLLVQRAELLQPTWWRTVQAMFDRQDAAQYEQAHESAGEAMGILRELALIQRELGNVSVPQIAMSAAQIYVTVFQAVTLADVGFVVSRASVSGQSEGTAAPGSCRSLTVLSPHREGCLEGLGLLGRLLPHLLPARLYS